MGVSGSGKSSVGILLAETLGLPYVEGDELHPKSNVEKMSKGTPLTDEDRWPWLDIIGGHLAESASTGVVITCSALKLIYRDRLRKAAGGKLAFVFLDGSKELLTDRMGHRAGHFMPLSLLETQLATLERPDKEDGVVTVDIDATPEAIADAAAEKLAELKWP
ncbi:gluconokinase [Rhizobiales bacterium RZME27]|uniref:Gluconokinase n=1 Tax=Endobacterium cereale TaxID=2663029 RepID=A0A6A8A239_9HYPH|nr:gluconokinase [Endobacterium cereale]MEB2844600.1 gluconokinase [Endobacterium cereale]MQY45085.1 gluconokinase [Endobacterium cereale]